MAIAQPQTLEILAIGGPVDAQNDHEHDIHHRADQPERRAQHEANRLLAVAADQRGQQFIRGRQSLADGTFDPEHGR